MTQRKGKVLCIYDMRLQFSVSSLDKNLKDEENSEGKSSKATITLPEFVHDQDEDEYEFEVNAAEHAAQIKKHLLPQLKAILMKFQSDLLEAHAKDVQHASGH